MTRDIGLYFVRKSVKQKNK